MPVSMGREAAEYNTLRGNTLAVLLRLPPLDPPTNERGMEMDIEKEAARLEILQFYPDHLRRLGDQMLCHTPAELSPDDELFPIVCRLRQVADEMATIAARQEKRLRRRNLRVVTGSQH